MSAIEVKTEEEITRGWRYGVRVVREDGRASEHTVTLAWVDHEHWSGGMAAPSRVVEGLMRFLVEREGDEDGREIPEKFDASTVRRWYPGVDEGLVI